MDSLHDCKLFELESVLVCDLEPDRQHALEAHLEDCETCRERLHHLAADGGDWNKATQHLSSQLTAMPEVQPTVVLSRVGTEPSQTPPHWLDAPSHPELLGKVDHFQIEEEIGRGGCGVVYRGFDTHLNRPVAIKFLAAHFSSNGVARQRFAREARAAAAVVHPNVVPIHNVSTSGNRPYLVMSLVDGRSLEARVKANGPFELKEAVRIAVQIASGLDAAHRQGLIHRDIKPANILLEQDVSRVMITDFGLARAADDLALTQTGWLAGTPHYMSPEQAQGNTIDCQSDLFSLGSVLYFMVTGRQPFRAENPLVVMQDIVRKQHLSARDVNNEVSATLSQIIDKLLEKNPRDRFGSAGEAKRVLEQYLAHLNNPVGSPKVRPILTRWQRQKRWIAVGISTGVCASLLAVWLLVPTLFRERENEGPNPASNSVVTQPSAGETKAESLRETFNGVKTFDEIQQELDSILYEVNQLESQFGWPEMYSVPPSTALPESTNQSSLNEPNLNEVPSQSGDSK